MPSFPTSLPSFAAISSAGGDKLDTVGKEHDSGHNNLGDEIEALAAKLGIFASTPAWGTELVGGIIGTAWAGPATMNPLVNARMLFAQRSTSSSASFAAVADNAYTLDRWVYRKSGAMVHTISQSAANLPPVYANHTPYTSYSLLLDVTTVDSSIAAGDYCTIGQRILGRRWAAYFLRPFTLTFWVRAPKAGTYCVSFRNSGKDRSYVAEFVVAAANTWEYKILTVSAIPSGGTWDMGAGIGIEVCWALAAGSTHQTTAGAWQNGNFLASANQVNACDNTANDFHLAFPTIHVGAADRAIELVDPAVDFWRCLEFYRKTFPFAIAPAQNAGTASMIRAIGYMSGVNWLSFPVDFRAHPMVKAPTVTTYNPSATNAQGRNTNLGVDCTNVTPSIGETGGDIQVATTAGSLPGHFYGIHATFDAEI
jgi:hypothetical protein